MSSPSGTGFGDDNSERLASLGLESLELRRVLKDLLYTYKILSTELTANHKNTLFTPAHGLVYVNAENFLTVNSSSQMTVHAYKLYICSSNMRRIFGGNRIVNIWNSFPAKVNFASVASFKQ